jgi:uncharacterized damage-inducible protein DinB
LHLSLQENSFSLGDLARHIILIERDLYLPILEGYKSKYQGCESHFAPTLPDILALYENTMMQMHQLISPQAEAYFQEKCTTPVGAALRKGIWLRALIEHEIHHRGQIYLLLRQLGIDVPQIYQLSSEDVIRLSELQS